MFWNKKKKNDDDEIEQIEEVEDELSDLDDLLNSLEVEDDEKLLDDIASTEASEEEIEAYLNELLDEENTDENEEEDDESEAEKDVSDNKNLHGSEKNKALVKPANLDSFADFVNNRAPGALQFMIKETSEVFEIRESHIRMAEVLGVVMMAKECSESELEKIYLAKDLLDDKDKFYVLPSLTQNEFKETVEAFCEENFGDNGKKYTSNAKKFLKMLKENDLQEEWRAFTKAAVFEKLETFCDANGITFDD